MKKIIIAMLITMFFCTTAYAKRGITVTSKSGRVKRVTRGNFISTTTQVSTTGLTNTTSGKSKKVKKKALLNRFVADNFNNISIDIAKGSGEYVEAIAEIIEVSGEKKVKFFQNLKTNFEIIFPSLETDHEYVVTEISRIGKSS